MNRNVNHTAYVNRNFADICSHLESDGRSVLSDATDHASQTASNLVVHLEQDLQFFRVDEVVTIKATELVRRSDLQAVMTLEWLADPRKRLLPNLRARLELNAIIPRGPSATTAISVIGKFDPPAGLFQRLEAALITRRVVDAAAHSFIETMAEVLEEQLPAPPPRKAPRSPGSTSVR